MRSESTPTQSGPSRVLSGRADVVAEEMSHRGGRVNSLRPRKRPAALCPATGGMCRGAPERRHGSSGSRARIAVVAIVALTAPSGCLDPIPDNTITPPGTGSLVGQVRDACDQRPLANIKIAVDARNDMTDGEGRYQLHRLSAGLHVVTVFGKDYETQEKTVQIDAGRSTRVVVDLVPLIKTALQQPLLDVLFVVDNSGSMEQEQLALAQAFPAFIDELRYSFVNLRVGVISTDMGTGNYRLPSCEVTGGDDGALQTTPQIAGCATPSKPWIATSSSIEDGKLTIQDNVASGTAEDAFSCIGPVGVFGCGFEQPLAAITRALEPDHPVNVGFVRPKAALAIVVLSDEDDCSTKDPSLYDPMEESLVSLGPLTSFRCFEFGVTCDINDRQTGGPRKDCAPTVGGKYLQEIASVVAKLKALKGASPVFFARIGGPSTPVAVDVKGIHPTLKPSCQTNTGSALPAIRLQAIVDAFAPRSSFDSICTSDLTPTLRSVAKKIIATALVNACQ